LFPTLGLALLRWRISATTNALSLRTSIDADQDLESSFREMLKVAIAEKLKRRQFWGL
jgi:hypothetical protein